MYNIALLLHSYNRWLVVIFMILATGYMWWGILRQKEWSERAVQIGAGFKNAVNIQFVLGIILYLLPQGMARGAWRDLGAAMDVDNLRFFAFEHPLQMFIAVGAVNMGWNRSQEATLNHLKFRWAAGTYTLAMILVLSIIPWWRPLLRPINPNPQSSAEIRDITQLDGEGDASQGELIFRGEVDGVASCEACHTTDSSRRVGPGLGDIGLRAGQRVEGQSAEQYLLTSIVEPDKYIVDGYSNMMPPNFGEDLSDQQLLDLIAYLLTLQE